MVTLRAKSLVEDGRRFPNRLLTLCGAQRLVSNKTLPSCGSS